VNDECRGPRNVKLCFFDRPLHPLESSRLGETCSGSDRLMKGKPYRRMRVGGRRAERGEEKEHDNQRGSSSELHHRLSSPKIRRRQRSSSTVHPFCLTFSHRLVRPPSYALASSLAT
jgi:hypothetical protein